MGVVCRLQLHGHERNNHQFTDKKDHGIERGVSLASHDGDGIAAPQRMRGFEQRARHQIRKDVQMAELHSPRQLHRVRLVLRSMYVYEAKKVSDK